MGYILKIVTAVSLVISITGTPLYLIYENRTKIMRKIHEYVSGQTFTNKTIDPNDRSEKKIPTCPCRTKVRIIDRNVKTKDLISQHIDTSNNKISSVTAENNKLESDSTSKLGIDSTSKLKIDSIPKLENDSLTKVISTSINS